MEHNGAAGFEKSCNTSVGLELGGWVKVTLHWSEQKFDHA